MSNERVDYPLQIIPKENYEHRIKIDAIKDDVPGCVVQRRSDCPEFLAFEFGEADATAITSHAFVNIAQMSMNLMGGEFKSEHAFWSQKDKARELWNGGVVDHELLIEYCEPVEKVPLFYYLLSDLHNLVFPQPRRYQKEKDVKSFKIINDVCDSLKKKLDESVDTDKYVIVEGELRICHVPTNMNYWHVQLEAFSKKEKDEFVPYPKSRYEDLRPILLELMKNSAILSPTIVEIPTHFYDSVKRMASR